MGAIGGLLGLNGGANGTGYQITPGTNGEQLQGAYAGAQNSLASQQALLAALQGQNGIGNQSQVYNQLQGVVAGTGPNPAQAMLNNATGQNVATQAALMAGQRGASANPALLARQAAAQGAATQQQAVGQGAALQANQALGALGQAGHMANTQAAQQIGATNANTQANLGEQQLLQGANSAANAANAGLANTTMQGQQALIGGVLQGAGMAAGLASGGSVPGPQSAFGQFMRGTPAMTSGGKVPAMVSPDERYYSPSEAKEVASGKKSPLKTGEKIPGKAKVSGDSPKNDTVPRMLEPGGVVVKRSIADDPDKAAKFVHAVLAKKKGRAA